MTDKFFKISVLGLLISIFIFLFFQEAVFGGNPEQIIPASNGVSEQPQALSVAPVAVPVLTPQEAEKVNNEVLNLYKKAQRKKDFELLRSKVWTEIKNHLFLSPLLFVLFFIDVIIRNRRKTNNIYISVKRRLIVLVSVLFLLYSFWVFVPWSVYFGNSSQFPFIFLDFVNENLFCLTVTGFLAACLLLAIPPTVSDYLVLGIAGLGLCTYFQSMFMNIHLGKMDGTTPEWDQHLVWGGINITIWCVLIAIPFVIKRYFRNCWSICLAFGSGVFLLLEIIATLSMLLSAPPTVWERSSKYCLDGSKQFELHNNKNIIVFIFDALGSGYIKYCFDEDPKYKDIVKDFTWYIDARSNYRTTFPGLHHELTGAFVQPANNQNELFNHTWHTPSAQSFYKQIKEAGFDSRLYVNAQHVLGPLESYHEYFSNIIASDVTYIVDKKKIRNCLIKISGFNVLPYYLKKYCFYDDNIWSETVLEDSVSTTNSVVPRKNDQYLKKMMATRLTTDSAKPVLAFHYTTGAHPVWMLNEKCERQEKPYDDPLPTIKSCFYVLSEFIRILKDNNLYDNTAIILCSDHGAKGGVRGKSIRTPFDMSFMIKPFCQKNESLQIAEAKFQSIDILPTLLQLACGEKADFSVFDGFPASKIPADRKRVVYDVIDHPDIPAFLVDYGSGACDGNCLREFSFVDVDSFSFSSKSFVRHIPLNVNARVDEKILHQFIDK